MGQFQSTILIGASYQKSVFGFRKLKLLREFLKLMKTELPVFKLHVILILPSHLNISHHENPSPAAYRNVEFLRDLNLNVIHQIEKHSQVQIEFMEVKAGNNSMLAKLEKALIVFDNRRYEPGGTAVEVAYRFNPLLQMGKVNQDNKNNKQPGATAEASNSASKSTLLG